MQSDQYCTDLVRRYDRDRYLASLFAPAPARAHLFALYAFNVEIARVRESVSEAPLGEMRLQWWRESIAGIYHGNVPEHPVGECLASAISHANLPQSAFQNLIDARQFDLYDDPMPTLNDLDGYLGETSSIVIQLAALILAGSDAQAGADGAGHAGVAYGVTGLLRALPVHRARGQCYLPKKLLEDHATNPAHILSGRWGRDERAAIGELCDVASKHLARAREAKSAIPSAALPAFLPLSLVDGFLKILSNPAFTPLETIAEMSQLRRQWILLRNAALKKY